MKSNIGILTSAYSIRTILTRMLILTGIGIFITSCDSDDDDTVNVVTANTPAGLANCFAFSIDQVGRGNLQAGIDKFDGCLSDDYTFQFQFSVDSAPIVCPSAECPIQEFSSVADLRARFAGDFFTNAGYQATQHQILNVDVDQSGNRSEVFAYIQANHFLPNNSVDIAWNDYSFVAVKENGRWVIESEEIIGTSFLNFQGGPVGG